MSMTQEQYSGSQIHTDYRQQTGLSSSQIQLKHGLRLLCYGVGITLLLTCIEAILWLLNPGHIFGHSATASITSFFALPVEAPLLWLVPLCEIALGYWLASLIAQPLAKYYYLKAMYQVTEHYRSVSTPLQDWSHPYDMPLVYRLDTPNPTIPRQEKTLAILELVEILQTGTPPNLLLLGERGMGKTVFVHQALASISQRRQDIALGRLRLPILVPLKYYAPLRQALDLPDTAPFSLLDFLSASDLPGLAPLLPYLKKLATGATPATLRRTGRSTRDLPQRPRTRTGATAASESERAATHLHSRSL
jgi:hypothetical protein